MRKILLLLLVVASFAALFGTEAPGYVAITSSDGVKILLNGVHVGTIVGGELILSLTPGTYILIAQKEGYEDERVFITVQSGRSTSVNVELTQAKIIQENISTQQKVFLGQKTGTINIYSIPFPSAKVSINGVNYGETDIRLTNFPVGKLTVKVDSSGKSLQAVFTLKENETIDLQANFVDGKIYQLFTVSFDFPDDVEVTIDENIIKKNESVVLIGPDHRVEMKATDLSGYEPSSVKQITVTANGSYELSPDFSKEYIDYVSTLHPGELVLVEKGSFTMGDTWGDVSDEEKPIHSVELTYDFQIGPYEVTFDQYNWFCEETGRKKPSDNSWGRGSRPVINVSWNDAVAYCNWLSEKEKLPKAYDNNGNLLDKDGKVTSDPSKVVGYRLPTEAEWEYAARGGNKSKGYKYSGSDNVDNVAWYDSNSGSKTQEVGKKAPNELGLYDMSGNVWEWCSDWYGAYSSSAQTNPYNNSGSWRVYRGGSWDYDAARARVALRYRRPPTGTDVDLGFRIARTVP
ncbi:formylglycine-generating enzyme family protein [Mesotoga sp.]|uniref:SUMF1/EgtB/PvdO family nonheme iron enzyme n=1 Tax=Mesotoga sp. TaxID=2053577 RepID=UPI001BD6D2C6|nr:formylglycine-generating enzyme family protein [Mesotoga sp.]